ncbi:polyphosphate kinase [Actinomycetota bacterium]|nr:polyphosphate kinase [Actinomycetota bacterium]
MPRLSLVIRDEPNGLRRYCHLGTGNYNPKTARAYEDLGILSADSELTEDLTKLFNQLSGFAPQSTYSRLLVAPSTLRSGSLSASTAKLKIIKLASQQVFNLSSTLF